MDELTIPFLGPGAGDVAVPVRVAARGRARRSRWAPTGPSRPRIRCSRWRWRSPGSADEHRGERPPFLPDERLDLDDALAAFTTGTRLGQPPRGRGRLDRGREGGRPRRPRSRPVRPRGRRDRRGAGRRHVHRRRRRSTRRPRSRADARRRRHGRMTMSIRRRMSVLRANRAGRCSSLRHGTDPRQRKGDDPVNAVAVMYVNQHLDRPSGRGPAQPDGLAGRARRSLRAAYLLRSRKPRGSSAATADPWSRSSRTIRTGADLSSALAPPSNTRRPPFPPDGGLRVSGAARSAQVGGRVDVADASRRRGRGRATSPPAMTVAVERLDERAQPALAVSEEASPRVERRVATQGDRAAGGLCRRARGRRRRRRARRAPPASTSRTAPTSVGMSPPTTRTIGSRARREARPRRRPAGLRRRPGRGRCATSAGRSGPRRARRRRGSRRRERPDGVDGVAEQRPAVDRLGQLVAPEPARSAAGEDDAR